MVPEAIKTVCELIEGTLRREPDREFNTVELATATGIPARDLAAFGPYMQPFARRGAERPGFGKQSGRMVRPFLWAYPQKEAANDCT